MAALVYDQDGGRAPQGARGNSQVLVPRRARSGAAGDAGLGARPSSRRPLVTAMVVVALALTGGSIADAVARVVARPAAPTGSGSTMPAPAVRGEVVVVRPGQTYWSIAEDLGGWGDIRARVDALQDANADRVLRAGDRLVVPS